MGQREAHCVWSRNLRDWSSLQIPLATVVSILSEAKLGGSMT